nr:WD repeat-containing protein 97 [Meriones unguiculatus]
MLNTSNPFSFEGDSIIADSDFYDQDNYEVPDPGVLPEKHELGLLEEPQAPQLFTSSERWQNINLRTRARLLWLHLRTYLHYIVEKEKKAELRVARMVHGLEPLRRLKVAAGLCSVAQDPARDRFVVLDAAGCLHQHTKDGWVLAKLKAPAVLHGLVTVPGSLGKVGRFVGWGPAGLSILGEDFNLLWLSQPPVSKTLGQELFHCLPVPTLGLLLVAQVGGSLELWKFRSGGRRLVSCGSPLHPPPGLSGSFSCMALGSETDPCNQYCFAAYGSAVLTFDLDSWTLINACHDLHKTVISDMEYCEEVEALMTASRDSTLKVWEADWQIRMVFVGHTGPVTAMAVLPNSALAVSASQDGTLRTWDLRAASQVGEVTLDLGNQDALSEKVSKLLAPARPGWPVLSLCSKSVDLWHMHDLYSPLAQLSAPVLHVQIAPVLPTPIEPALPSRLVCACADGSVYLVSATTGRTVSSLLLEPEDAAIGVVYCLTRESLWVLTRSGELVRANAARCPMVVLHRLPPPPPPAPQPCCLHLYSHLTDPRSAFACWELVRQFRGDMRRSAIAWAWKNKNRFLPIIGHSDGSLSVKDWRSSETVFHTEAHSPGPVTAIGSTWNTVVTSGGDLTVKMWRVFPYAEESLSLVRTFSCCHPVVMLCVLGKRITVGFEHPETATYGLVQFGMGDRVRCDHRPQDDPMDHITGLCCCPTLKIYACSSLDCTIRIWTWDNRLLRLLQLDGPPQTLAFSSNSGDLVLTLGSRLCLVRHTLYLPTSYLLKHLCEKTPEIVNDPPLSLSNQTPLTSTQLQRLASLHGAASLSVDAPFSLEQTATRQQPVLKEDLETIIARDQDLQELREGLVVPATLPPLSWKQQQEAFDSYLQRIYGSDMLDIKSEWLSLQWDSDYEDVLTSDAPAGYQPPAPGAPGKRFARPPQVSLPIPPTFRKVHSRASQLLAHSSLCYELGLSLDLRAQWDQYEGQMVDLDLTAYYQRPRVPLLLQRRPREPLSKLGGFFPATIQPFMQHTRVIRFPGCVPNSVILRQLWLHEDVKRLGSLEELSTLSKVKLPGSRDGWWHRRVRRPLRWRNKQFRRWLHHRRRKGREYREEEEDFEYEDFEEMELEWTSIISEQPEPWDAKSDTALDWKPSHDASRTKIVPGYSLWEDPYGHLPKFLHYFVVQNWFKKLFPIFSLKAYPEMGTIEGLVSAFLEFLIKANWADRVNILNALLRLLPNVSAELRMRIHGKLLYLLNHDFPPSLLDMTQKEFVMLAFQLLLACSLEVLDVLLEIMSYFLCSPASCQSELKSLLISLGLRDPHDILFKEMLTWSEGSTLKSKSRIRALCQEKLEEIVLTSESEVRVQELLASPRESIIELQTQVHRWPSRRALADTLQAFSTGSQGPSSAPQSYLELSIPSIVRRGPLPLEETEWSRYQMMDLFHIDVLNFYCEKQHTQQKSLLEEEEEQQQLPLDQLRPNIVVRPPRYRWLYPILRLQEARRFVSYLTHEGHRPSHQGLADGISIRMLKLPLPRVELQPFPPGWPSPPRALPPLLLQPSLQRYFFVRKTTPGKYN